MSRDTRIVSPPLERLRNGGSSERDRSSADARRSIVLR
jgi:hypothetical protein